MKQKHHRERRTSDVEVRVSGAGLSPIGPSISESRLHLASILLFAALPVLFYGRYLFGDRMLFGTDWLGAGSYEWRQFMASYIHSHGNVALWWPNLLCGQPTVAGFFADMYYPTFLLRLLLPVHVVWTWTFVIHHFLAGLGTYLFLRELRVSTVAAAVGGVAYELAGSLVTLAYAGHDGRLIGSALMPLALFFLHRGMTRRRFYWFVFSGFIVALQLLSGHAQKVYYTGLVLTAYFLFHWVHAVVKERSAGPAVRLALYFLLLFVFAGALASIQYLPVYGNLAFSARGGERGWAYATSWSMPIIETLDLLTPKFSGGLETYWGENPFKLHSEYLGVIPLFFAALAVLRRWKDRNVKFFTFSFLGALLMAWGGNTPFYYLPYYLFPGVSKFRGPAMVFFLAAFSLVVLAGLGIDYVLTQVKENEARKAGRSATTVAAVPALLFLLFAALRGPMTGLLRSATLASEQKFGAIEAAYPGITTGLLVAAFVAAVGWLAVYLISRRRIRETAFAAGLVAVMVLDMGLSLNLWNESKGYIRGVAPPKDYFAPDEAVAFLKQDTTLHRVLPWHYERSDDGILAYNGVQSVAGQMPNPLQVYQDIIGSGTSVMFRADNLLDPNLMNLANVKYIISQVLPEDVSRYDARSVQAIQQIKTYLAQPQFLRVFSGQKYTVFQNSGALPRAFVVSSYEVVRNSDEVLSRLRMPDFDPGRTALLYESPGFAADSTATDDAAEVAGYDCNEVTVQARAATGGLLILSDVYHPDWRVTVDGRPARLLQAYHAFRAVPLPGGTHEVVFRYVPRYYRLGSLLSLAALALLCGTLIVAAVRRKRPV